MKTLTAIVFCLALTLSGAQVWAADELVLVKGGTFADGQSRIRKSAVKKTKSSTKSPSGTFTWVRMKSPKRNTGNSWRLSPVSLRGTICRWKTSVGMMP